MGKKKIGIMICFLGLLMSFVVSNSFSKISATDDQEILVEEVIEEQVLNEEDTKETVLLEPEALDEEEPLQSQTQIGTRALGVADVTNFAQLKDTVELANLTNDTVTIKLMNSFDFEEGISISSNVEIIAVNGQTATLRRKAGFTNSEFFHVQSNGQLKLSAAVTLHGNNINIVSTNASAIDVEGVLVIDGAIITKFEAYRNSPIVVRDGGEVILESGSITANEIIGGYLLANGGGAAQVYNNGTFTMNGGSIDNNTVNVWGAGISVLNDGAFYLNNGEIHHNQQLQGDATGGGIYIEEGGDFTMNNGRIHSNQAGGGAGISVGHPNDPGIDVSQININAGEIYDNQAIGPYGFGGGIFIASEHPIINMTNLYVSDNTATYGGGIYNCPTSDTKNYITNGSIFVNNTASTGGNFFYSAASAAGFENRDFYISDRVLGGGLQKVYEDFSPRYLSGDQPLESNAYQNVNSQMLLHNEIVDTATLDLAKADAKIFIHNNSAAMAGGGITNNAFLTIGERNAEKTLKIKKEWEVEANKLPASIDVQLIRIDEHNNEVDLEKITLTKSNGWAILIGDLPGNYSYRVKEVDADQYEVAYNEVVSGREITITITNKNKTNKSIVTPSLPSKMVTKTAASTAVETGINNRLEMYIFLMIIGCLGMAIGLKKNASNNNI